jgi:ribose transport system ATP-binding protein
MAVLAAAGLSKRYAAVQALDDVGITLAAGEIHALVGENGSGKSTLVGIVAGTVARDAGTVRIGGVDLGRATPRRAQRLGAVTVFQDGSLIGELSVAMNLYLGTPAELRPPYRRVRAWAEELLRGYGFDIDPDLPAAQLPPGDRQLVEIIRAVASRPAVLILDEATSALDPTGVDVVLGLLRTAAANGVAVLFVTHRLSEVMRVADAVTVLRDGRFQGTYAIGDVTPQRLVESMAGTRVDLEFPDRPGLDGDTGDGAVLAARGLRGPAFGPADVELRGGEIVGIAGADGNGQVPLLRGLARWGDSAGTVTVAGRQIGSYAEAIRAGVVFLSSDRRQESLFAGLTIADNLGLGVLPELSDHGLMRTRREAGFVRSTVDRYRIRVGHPKQIPAELSGGNQQKVALSRVLAMKPAVVLIDEPTQGVDVRSRLDIYRFLREIADSGSAVVVASSDASELAGLCDRILVMSRGRVTDSLVGTEASEESIVGAFAVERALAIDASAVEELAEAAGVGTPVASAPVVQTTARAGRRPWWRAKVSADLVRIPLLLLLIVLLGGYAQAKNSTFLTTLSLYNVMLLALPLVAVAAAQYFVLLVGGIDVSIGATMTLTVVVASYWVLTGSPAAVVVKSLGVIAVVGIAMGALNAVLVERIGLSAVIATIATLGIASGVALILRPTAGGLISPELNKLAVIRTGPVPYSLIVLVILLALTDVLLRRTGFGLRVRAVGLNGIFAARLGIPARRVRSTCYLLCSVLAALAGILLAGQVGIGDPNAGNSFTLLAIAAPVLGGAALSGGHGSLVGAALGSLILVVSQSLVSVLGLTDGAGLIFAGALTLLALLSSADSLRELRRLLHR